MAALSDSWRCSGKGEILLYGALSASGCSLSSDSKPCCWGSGCTRPPHFFRICPFLMPTKSQDLLIPALLVPTTMTTQRSGKSSMTRGDFNNCGSYFCSLVLSRLPVEHLGSIPQSLRCFHGAMGTVEDLGQAPPLAILHFCFFNPSPHPFSTCLLWDHLCFFLSLPCLLFPVRCFSTLVWYSGGTGKTNSPQQTQGEYKSGAIG